MTVEEQRDQAERRAVIALQALMDIAHWEDAGGNAHLAATGSYSCFDEPSSVARARRAISEISP